MSAVVEESKLLGNRDLLILSSPGQWSGDKSRPNLKTSFYPEYSKLAERTNIIVLASYREPFTAAHTTPPEFCCSTVLQTRSFHQSVMAATHLGA